MKQQLWQVIECAIAILSQGIHLSYGSLLDIRSQILQESRGRSELAAEAPDNIKPVENLVKGTEGGFIWIGREVGGQDQSNLRREPLTSASLFIRRLSFTDITPEEEATDSLKQACHS